LLNKHHFCYVQTPQSRKLRKVDDTSVSDLTTEVTALIKKAMPITWSTNGGKFNTRYEVPLTIVLPEFSSSMEVQWSCAIDENPDSTYDMILGRDLQSALRMDI
jgi:hypothetical protein